MIAKLKQSAFGKILYRLSRSIFGRPLRRLSTWLQSESTQMVHMSAKNRQHNREQVEILERFETEIREAMARNAKVKATK
ncbi:hypothetical protein [Tritonibacter sp. SIMBA_163]|uniref:hypothetical protein n=1 Tax=Tritonibacter sp. SIMBA_163 TaxID=3080868 RepID=UPI00397FCDEC